MDWLLAEGYNSILIQYGTNPVRQLVYKSGLAIEKMNQRELAIPNTATVKKAYNKSESIQIALHGFDRLDMLTDSEMAVRLARVLIRSLDSDSATGSADKDYPT